MKLLARLCLTLLALTAGAPLTQATLKFEEIKIEHTATAEETSFTGTYKFENTGQTDVTIKKVSTSCGCTSADLKKKEYKAGEKGTLDVTFKYDDRQGFQMKTITVETNEGTQSLTLEVEIPEFVTI